MLFLSSYVVGMPVVAIFVILVLVVGISTSLFTYFFKCFSGQGVVNTSFDLFECNTVLPFCIILITVYVDILYLPCNLPPLWEMSFCFSFKTMSPMSILTGLSFLRLHNFSSAFSDLSLYLHQY